MAQPIIATGKPITDAVHNASGGLPYLEILIWIVIAIAVFFFLRWIVRLLFEFVLAGQLIYVQVALPRSDSKLDKEHETKKDFKEKIGIMNLVHNSLWKISGTTLTVTIMNYFFNYVKISYEIIYKDGQVFFFLVTYRSLFSVISQTITSIYPDAEIVIREKKDYIEFSGNHGIVRTTSIRKADDTYFPIKTYKYFEDDPLGTFTNVF